MRGDLPIPGSVRARLLDIAQAKFSTQPYETVDVKAVAAEAGVTIGALYHHFGSKGGLYAVLHEEMLSRVLDRIEAATDDAPAPDKLRSGVKATFGGMLKVKGGYLLTAPPPNEFTSHQIPDRLSVKLAELAQETGIREPELTAELLAVSIRTAVQHVSQHPEQKEAMQQALLALIP